MYHTKYVGTYLFENEIKKAWKLSIFHDLCIMDALYCTIKRVRNFSNLLETIVESVSVQFSK